MNGAEKAVGRTTDIFHDIDFARFGPTNLTDVATESPEGGPQADATRHFDASFDPTIFEINLVGGKQAGGSVLAWAVVAGHTAGSRVYFSGGNHQITGAIKGGIIGAIGVIF